MLVDEIKAVKQTYNERVLNGCRLSQSSCCVDHQAEDNGDGYRP